MEGHCEFLEQKLGKGQGDYLECGIGVNFYHVVEDGRDLCRTCRMPEMAAGGPRCRHQEFYSFLRTRISEERFVSVEVECALKRKPLANLSECSSCPDLQPVSLPKP